MTSMENQSPQRLRDAQQEEAHLEIPIQIQITPDILNAIEEMEDQQIGLEIGGDEMQIPSSPESEVMFFTGTPSWEAFKHNLKGRIETEEDANEYSTFLDQSMAMFSEEDVVLNPQIPQANSYDYTEDNKEK